MRAADYRSLVSPAIDSLSKAGAPEAASAYRSAFLAHFTTKPTAESGPRGWCEPDSDSERAWRDSATHEGLMDTATAEGGNGKAIKSAVHAIWLASSAEVTAAAQAERSLKRFG